MPEVLSVDEHWGGLKSIDIIIFSADDSHAENKMSQMRWKRRQLQTLKGEKVASSYKICAFLEAQSVEKCTALARLFSACAEKSPQSNKQPLTSESAPLLPDREPQPPSSELIKED